MFSKEFINNFSLLGEMIIDWDCGNAQLPIVEEAIRESYNLNPFFTPFMQRNAIVTIAKCFFNKDNLTQWGDEYSISCDNVPLNIAVNCAGNLPLVGLQDIMCVLATGNNAIIKLSGKDKFLIPALLNILCDINPFWRNKFYFTNSLYTFNECKLDAILSMGSDETVCALKGAFEDVPMLLRGHKFSFAVLSGVESCVELENLVNDMFLYFGMGCRSVSYLLVPKNYNFNALLDASAKYRTLLAYDCYMNSYKRERAIALMNGELVIDGGFFLLKFCSNYNLPVGVIGVMEYENSNDVERFHADNVYKIQKKYCTFGTAQAPLPNDYPNGEDVIDFILKLKN